MIHKGQYRKAQTIEEKSALYQKLKGFLWTAKYEPNLCRWDGKAWKAVFYCMSFDEFLRLYYEKPLSREVHTKTTKCVRGKLYNPDVWKRMYKKYLKRWGYLRPHSTVGNNLQNHAEHPWAI